MLSLHEQLPHADWPTEWSMRLRSNSTHSYDFDFCFFLLLSFHSIWFMHSTRINAPSSWVCFSHALALPQTRNHLFNWDGIKLRRRQPRWLKCIMPETIFSYKIVYMTIFETREHLEIVVAYFILSHKIYTFFPLNLMECAFDTNIYVRPVGSATVGKSGILFSVLFALRISEANAWKSNSNIRSK